LDEKIDISPGHISEGDPTQHVRLPTLGVSEDFYLGSGRICTPFSS
jgi:hypothetical protein